MAFLASSGSQLTSFPAANPGSTSEWGGYGVLDFRDGGDVQLDKVSVGGPPEHKIFRQLSKLGAQGWDLV